MAEAETRCVLDPELRGALLSIVHALRKETDSIDLNGEGEIDLEALEERITECDAAGKRGTRKRGPREPSAYNVFIGQCRASPDKGGQGKDFKECVALWNQQKGGG